MVKKLRARPRKRWTDTVEEDLKKTRIRREWGTLVQNREKFREIVMAAKTLKQH